MPCRLTQDGVGWVQVILLSFVQQWGTGSGRVPTVWYRYAQTVSCESYDLA